MDSDEPVLELVKARHPCIATPTGDFIPNDFSVGVPSTPGDVAPICVLLTGCVAAHVLAAAACWTRVRSRPARCVCVWVCRPNMGGKSTLLRQTCLSVIVAQMVRFRPSMRDVVAQC